MAAAAFGGHNDRLSAYCLWADYKVSSSGRDGSDLGEWERMRAGVVRLGANQAAMNGGDAER